MGEGKEAGLTIEGVRFAVKKHPSPLLAVVLGDQR
jgi:hypothetical protein